MNLLGFLLTRFLLNLIDHKLLTLRLDFVQDLVFSDQIKQLQFLNEIDGDLGVGHCFSVYLD